MSHWLDALQVVAPKRAALAEANGRLNAANTKLGSIRAKVAELRERVASLEASLMKVLLLAELQRAQQWLIMLLLLLLARSDNVQAACLLTSSLKQTFVSGINSGIG